MTVIQMSERELTRLRVLIDLSDQRLTVEAAARLMGVGRRQVYRLRRAFAAGGPVALVSRKRGRPSNHRHGETFRRTVLTLVREHYPDFGPTLAVEKLAARRGAVQRQIAAVSDVRQDPDCPAWHNRRQQAAIGGAGDGEGAPGGIRAEASTRACGPATATEQS